MKIIELTIAAFFITLMYFGVAWAEKKKKKEEKKYPSAVKRLDEFEEKIS